VTSYIQYEGPRQIGERVLTPHGAGYVGALYPDTPYYQGRTVQVTLDGYEIHADVFPSDPEFDGYADQLDLLAATVYNVRAQSPRDMTPERWAVVKRKFRGSYQQCLEQAQLELEDM
jgi:hypothetical protein